MKKLGIMMAMLVVAATGAKAQLAMWENDNLVTATNSTPVDVVAAGVSAGALELGPGLAAPASTWENALDTGINANATNLSAAIANNHYFAFTVTPDAGKQVDYTNVAVRVTLNSLTNIGTSVQMVLMSSATGFADGDEIGSFTASAPDTEATDNGLIDIDIGGVAGLQDQPSPVEFRLYAVVAGTEGSYNRMALGHIFFEDGADDVRVDGTVEDATSLPVVTLARWDLDDLTEGGASTATVDMVHADMSSTDLIAQPGGFSTGIGWKYAMGGFADWRLGQSLEWTLQNKPNNYFTITLAPDSGKQVGYDKLFARFSVNAGSSGADVTFWLLSDQTGFATNSVLGSYNVVNTNGSYTPATYTHEFDLASVAELQDLTGPAEFRIYVTATSGNRMGIGQAFTLDGGADDLRVYGTIEDAPFLPATILSWTSVSDSVMKLVIDVPGDPALYYPKGSTDLALGFSGVAHSDNAAGPFEITNLTYSATEGGNEAIYVETTETRKFFGVGGE